MFKEELKKGFINGILKRSLRKSFKYKFYQRRRFEVRMLLSDVRYFPEELVYLLLEVKPDNITDIKKYINDWLHLESEMTQFTRKRYIIGSAKNVFKIITMQRYFYEETSIGK